jgi:hypothetical protein
MDGQLDEKTCPSELPRSPPDQIGERLRTNSFPHLIEVDVQFYHIDPRFAQHTENPAFRVPRDEPSLDFATRPTWYSAAAAEICGSSPLAEVVTRSTGTGESLPGSAFRSDSTRSRTAFSNPGFVGPRFEPIDDSALYGEGDVAEGRLQKYFGSLNGWPINVEPTVRPSRTIKLPFACHGKTAWAIAVTASG